MKVVWLVWYHNPDFKNREALWGIYCSEARANEECNMIERDFGYTTFYTFEIVNN